MAAEPRHRSHRAGDIVDNVQAPDDTNEVLPKLAPTCNATSRLNFGLSNCTFDNADNSIVLRAVPCPPFKRRGWNSPSPTVRRRRSAGSSLPYNISAGAGIQTSAKRNREACGFAFRHSRRCFQGLVGDIIVKDVLFDVRQVDGALIHCIAPIGPTKEEF